MGVSIYSLNNIGIMSYIDNEILERLIGTMIDRRGIIYKDNIVNNYDPIIIGSVDGGGSEAAYGDHYQKG